MRLVEKYQWAESKRERNLQKHGIDFALIECFDWSSALTREDTRLDYDEARYVSMGFIDSRLFVAVWTVRDSHRRLISLRKANKREVKIYDTA